MEHLPRVDEVPEQPLLEYGRLPNVKATESKHAAARYRPLCAVAIPSQGQAVSAASRLFHEGWHVARRAETMNVAGQAASMIAHSRWQAAIKQYAAAVPTSADIGSELHMRRAENNLGFEGYCQWRSSQSWQQRG